MTRTQTISTWLLEYFEIDVSEADAYAADLSKRLGNGTTNVSDSLNSIAGVKAVMHPTRREILRIMWEDKFSAPVEIAAILGKPLQATSYHMRMLSTGKGYGAIELKDTEPVRGAVRHRYRLTPLGEQLCLELFGPREEYREDTDPSTEST